MVRQFREWFAVGFSKQRNLDVGIVDWELELPSRHDHVGVLNDVLIGVEDIHPSFRVIEMMGSQSPQCVSALHGDQGVIEISEGAASLLAVLWSCLRESTHLMPADVLQQA